MKMKTKPNNPYYTPPHHDTLTTTRVHAQALLGILSENYPKESAMLIPRINYELEHTAGSTITFYLDADDVDEHTALTYACFDYMCKREQI